jgi:Signal transduction histidine kinase regulating C4-dicarboxylate transport system
MPTFTPVITNILLVNINVVRLNEQLELHGYKPVLVSDIKSISEIDIPYSLMLINENLITGNGSFNIEHLYFLNNNVPTAVLISDLANAPAALLKFLSGSTLEWVYSHEIESGLICSRLDKILIESCFNNNFQLLQQDLWEKEKLKKEILLRNQVLDHERELNANIAGSIASGLIIIDLKGIVIMLNENARSLFKLKSTDYIGSAYGNVFPAKIRVAIDDFLKKVLPGTLHHEMKKISIDSSVIEIDFYQMRDYGHNINGVLMLVNNITSQENTAQQLYRAEKLATMGTMLSGIAHELRNPLSVISARAQMALAKKAWDKDWALKNFESIEAQTCRCATIINNLLDFTRYRATQMAVHQVQKILDETLTYVEYQNSFDAITIEKKYQEGLAIFGDQSRFVQVFLNIITNASDAMNGKGNLRIKTWSDDPEWVVVEIKDNGSGIDNKVKDRIFDPFFTTKEPGKGTGLGLAVVYKIIHESGGEVWFTSEPGSTSFFVKLPTGMKRHE